MKHLVAVLLLLVGCGSRTPAVATPADPLPASRPAASAPESREDPRPDGVDAMSELLAAWHAEDLPGREALDRQPEAEASLVWLAQNGDVMNTRVRALKLLALYPSPEVAAVLFEIAGEPSNHAALRAGALHGLAGQDLTDPALAELVQKSVDDEDPRVRAAAEAALSSR
ncbi:MAG: HEAT repeat domain-containing protein [Myxococcota bacterium]